MKVAYLFGSLNRGGLEVLMLDVFKNISKADFDAIATHRKGGVLKEEFEKTSVPLNYIPNNRNIFAYLLKLRKYIINEKVNIIHAHQAVDAFFAFLSTFGLSIKIVLTLHGFGFGNEKLLNFILKRTSSNFYVSHYQMKFYIDKYRLNPIKQKVIYNGVDFTKFINNNENKTRYLKEELNIKNSTLMMGMVGNFNSGRNQLIICHFLKLLKEINIDFHFAFIGKRVENSPERFDNCVEFCKKNDLIKNVSFLGVRNDVPDILSQLDAFVYATEHDTFGIAVVEAIAFGIPVFVNDWEVMNEVTEDGKLAILYKTDNVNDLLEKFMLFLQKQDEYVRRAKENAEIVREKYSIEKHIENLKEVYLSLH